MQLNEQEIDLFAAYINEFTGLNFEEKKYSLKKSIEERIDYYDFKENHHYYEYLKFHPDGPVELRNLLTLITTNETFFFRNIPQFNVLRENILPEIIKSKLRDASYSSKRKPVLSIWSAGCSSGEEPYSIAMAVMETIKFFQECDIEILGTDIDKSMLGLAREGIYYERKLRNLGKYYIEKYFSETDNGEYKLRKEVKDLCTFDYFNLVEEPYPLSFFGKWDIIF
jgi:chemotaxis protein methyltransferase CheR